MDGDGDRAADASVYIDILLFEEAVRAQAVALQKRKVKYTVFALCLGLWNWFFLYTVFFNLSTYALLYTLSKLCLSIGIVTVILFYFSGLYLRTLVTPRKYLPYLNKAMRQFNLKVVPNKTTRPWRLFGRHHHRGEGGVKLVLNPKGIDGSFIEGWDSYRETYHAEIEKTVQDTQAVVPSVHSTTARRRTVSAASRNKSKSSKSSSSGTMRKRKSKI